MTTSNNPDLEARVAALEAELAAIKEQLDETDSAVQRGMDEVNQGLGRPARQVVKDLRTKFNLPSS